MSAPADPIPLADQLRRGTFVRSRFVSVFPVRDDCSVLAHAVAATRLAVRPEVEAVLESFSRPRCLDEWARDQAGTAGRDEATLLASVEELVRQGFLWDVRKGDEIEYQRRVLSAQITTFDGDARPIPGGAGGHRFRLEQARELEEARPLRLDPPACRGQPGRLRAGHAGAVALRSAVARAAGRARPDRAPLEGPAAGPPHGLGNRRPPAVTLVNR
jgi:hypothetical protein